jgi:stage IV sporulation protein A
MSMEQIYSVLEEVLYEFPVQEVNIRLPLWVEELEEDFWLREDMENAIRDILSSIKKSAISRAPLKNCPRLIMSAL